MQATAVQWTARARHAHQKSLFARVICSQTTSCLQRGLVMGEFDPRNPCPERYRDYLYLLARLRIGGRPVGIISPSDIVQATVLKAHKCRAQFQGQNEAQYRAYLRKILANTVADAFRDGANEAKIRRALDSSSARLES